GTPQLCTRNEDFHERWLLVAPFQWALSDRVKKYELHCIFDHALMNFWGISCMNNDGEGPVGHLDRLVLIVHANLVSHQLPRHSDCQTFDTVNVSACSHSDLNSPSTLVNASSRSVQRVSFLVGSPKEGTHVGIQGKLVFVSRVTPAEERVTRSVNPIPIPTVTSFLALVYQHFGITVLPFMGSFWETDFRVALHWFRLWSQKIGKKEGGPILLIKSL
ncbi:3400_t:CDS:2, partial [Acaulospora morrowiae]